MASNERESNYTYTDDDKLSEEAKTILKDKLGDVSKKVNVLMIGAPGVGKSTLLNSLYMAINKKGWEEVAKRGAYGPGVKPGHTCLLPTLSFPNQNVPTVFWDSPGWQNINDTSLKTLLELILDGYIPPKAAVLKDVNSKSAQLRRKYNKCDRSNAIHIALFVAAATQEPPGNLMKAIHETVSNEAREVPLLLVVTKIDQMKSEEDLKDRIKLLKDQTGFVGTDDKVFEMTLYCSDVMERDEGSGTTEIKRVEEIDKRLCALWRRILDTSYQELIRTPKQCNVS